MSYFKNLLRAKKEKLEENRLQLLIEKQVKLIEAVDKQSKDLKDTLLKLSQKSGNSKGFSINEEDVYEDYYEASRAYEDEMAHRVSARSFAAEGITYLNGMKVLFDQAVPMAPVALIPKGQAPTLLDNDAPSLPEGPLPDVLPRRVSGRQRLRYASRPDPLQRYRKTKQIEGYGYPEQDF